MNEKKIKELLVQAISDVDYIHFDEAIDQELSQMYIPDIFAEKFAELIIRECAEVANDHNSEVEGVTLGVGRALKQHFGVEE